MPADGATPDTAAELRLRSLLANAKGVRLRALAHTIWSVATVADIGPGGSSSVCVELSGTYIRDGAGVPQVTAYAARHDVVSCLGVKVRGAEAHTVGATLPDRGPGRRPADVLVLGREELAAARVVARWAIEQGFMLAPVIELQDAPTEHVLPEFPKLRGKCSCPCGGHKNGDADPSAVYDVERRRFSCLATGGRWKMRREGSGWRLFLGSSVSCEHAAKATATSIPTGPRAGSWPHSGATILGSLGPGMSWRSTKSSWLDLFERADRTGNGESATREAWTRAMEGETAACEGRTPSRQHEDRLIALDVYKLVWGTKWGRRRPVEKEVLGTGRCLFDLDQLGPRVLSASEWSTLGERADDIVRASELLERVEFLTETSSTGIQVIARLAGFFWDSAAFHRNPAVVAELERTGAALLELVDRGGHLDKSAFAPGRFGRLPGVRVRRGFVEHARLRWAGAPDNVVQLDAVRRERERRAV